MQLAHYPRLFGKYALVAPLARGGMGELHLAIRGEDQLEKLFVIKELLSELADREFIGRFLDEAKLVVKLSHGNLVPVFESGLHAGRYFLVMEYIEGKDLRAVWNTLDEAGRDFPLEVALHIVKELCRGLDYAHSYGDLDLVHRDISPPNVLLSYSGEVRLTDFGLAQSTIKLQKTTPGVLFGKLAYMAPEQAKDESVDARADIYSLGVILWELVTGERLFPPEGSQIDQLQRAATPQFRRPSTVKKGLPPEIDLITSRALAPRREDRFPSAEAMRQAVAALLAEIDTTADTATCRRFLRELYGETLERERNERRGLLERVSPKINEMRALAQQLATDPTEEMEAPPGEKDTDPLDARGKRPELPPGTVLGERYRIDALMRHGGMGTVYRATHTGIDKEVAVKVLHPLYRSHPDVVSRFRQEARAASRIGHPNIIEVFDSGTTQDGDMYFVMEYLKGQDLADLLESLERLTVDRTVNIGLQICRAVGAAHEAGIVHRDLKPENIFLAPRQGQLDFVKVLDFGIAQTVDLEGVRAERLTTPGTAMGTPEYMAPEQASGLACDHRADIYAVGALLYEMLAGQPPHYGDTVIEVITKKATDDVEPLASVRDDIPAELDRVILWALAKAPEERPQAMVHFAYELNKLVSGRAGAVASMLGLSDLAPSSGHELPPPTHATPPPRGSTVDTTSQQRLEAGRPPLWLLGAAALVALLGIGVAAFQLSKSRPPTVAAKRTTKGELGATETKLAQGDKTDLAAPNETRAPVRPATLTPSTGHPRPAAVAGNGAGRPDRRAPGSPKTRPRRRKGRAAEHLRAGHRHLGAGQFLRAKLAFDTASRSPKHRAAALVGLAEVAFQRRDYAGASRLAARAIRLGGGSRARLRLANAQFKLGHHRKAIGNYERVLKKSPRNSEAKRNLTAARRALKQHR